VNHSMVSFRPSRSAYSGLNPVSLLMADEERIRPPDSEVFRLCCDNTTIRKLTGFKPEYALRDGLKETIEWFTSPGNMNRYKAGIYNV